MITFLATKRCLAGYGFAVEMFFLGCVLFEVPSNLIINRVGARKWISRILVSWGW